MPPPPEIFILREGFRQSFICLLVVSKGTFQALKQLIFHYFVLDTVYIIVVRMECFFVTAIKDIFFSVCLFFLLTITGRNEAIIVELKK